MITGSLARRYARAVMGIGVESGNFEPLGNEIADIARAMKGSAELMHALTSPVFKRDQRRAVLDSIMQHLGASQVTRNFCNLLLDKERIGALPDISRELSAMIDDKAGRIKATVTSAQPLSPLQTQQLVQALEKQSGKTVEMTSNHDPELLGGVIAQLGDTRYDGSLRTQLHRMRDSLVK
jgi:F-type H+-transporting ATPase subunit delta